MIYLTLNIMKLGLGKMKQPKVLLYLLLLFILIAFATAGCHFCFWGDYKALSIKEGIAHFRFEYPCRYDATFGVHIEDEYTDVNVLSPWNNEVQGRTILTIFVIAPDAGLRDSKQAIEKDLSFWSDSDYQFLDRFALSIDGVEGEEIVYFYNQPRPPLGQVGHIPGAGPAPTIARGVYFDHKGLIWEITMSSNEATAETDKADFEHVLETFEILD